MLQNHVIRTESSQITLYPFRQQTPVPVTPSIDTLFHVPHDHSPSSLGKRVHDKWQEVSPLHGRGVLKLVNHDMLVEIPCFLEQERSIIPGNQHVK